MINIANMTVIIIANTSMINGAKTTNISTTKTTVIIIVNTIKCVCLFVCFFILCVTIKHRARYMAHTGFEPKLGKCAVTIVLFALLTIVVFALLEIVLFVLLTKVAFELLTMATLHK